MRSAGGLAGYMPLPSGYRVVHDVPSMFNFSWDRLANGVDSRSPMVLSSSQRNDEPSPSRLPCPDVYLPCRFVFWCSPMLPNRLHQVYRPNSISFKCSPPFFSTLNCLPFQPCQLRPVGTRPDPSTQASDARLQEQHARPIPLAVLNRPVASESDAERFVGPCLAAVPARGLLTSRRNGRVN